MPVPDYADSRPPYVQIAADLRQQIADGRYQPGDRLPANAALREQYSSANETVRRALGVLRDEGLIETHSTRGTFVLRQPPEPGAVPDLDALFREVSKLRGEVRSLTRRTGAAIPDDLADSVGRIEANLMDLYGKLGYEYPREGLPVTSRSRAHGERNGRRGQRA